MSNDTVAHIHHFKKEDYDEVVKVLAEYSGFILGEAAKNEKLSQEKLGRMLTIYVTNCVKKTTEENHAPDEGATCKHVYVKGNNAGQECGRKAKYFGVDGIPKCSSHRNSRPTKSSNGISDTPATNAMGNTFSYSQNKGKGKTVPQSMTTIQQTIAEQQKPAELTLSQTASGIFFNEATNIVFENRGTVEQTRWIAVGHLVDNIVELLTETTTYICYANLWMWDADRVEQNNNKDDYVSDVETGHPLLMNKNEDLIKQKLQNIEENSYN